MSDTTLWVAIVPDTPLSLGNATSNSNFIESAEFISGSALRGAVAEPLLAQVGTAHDRATCAAPDCPFCALFGDNHIQFGNAYLGDYAPVWPLPLTARSCKQFSGFTTDDPLVNAEQHHGVADMLFADLAYGMVADPAFRQRDLLQGSAPFWHPAHDPALRDKSDSCDFSFPSGTTCSHKLDRVAGTYQWRARPQRVAPTPIERHTHVGINRARNVAEDGLLFAQEQIDATRDQRAFFARIRVPDERVPALRQALQAVRFIGRGRSRGLGSVQVSVLDAPGYPDLRTRVTAFAAALQSALHPYTQHQSALRATFPGYFFSLTLRAPALVSDALGRTARFPTTAALGLAVPGHQIAAYARLDAVGGWDAAAGKPRRTQQALRTGSVLVYYVPPPTTLDELVNQLERLEENGIGSMRERGYGAVTVCANFHVAQARYAQGR